MIKLIRHIFIFILISSLFSITVQASIIHFCKESKVSKNLNQQNQTAEEEEEEPCDGDETTDEEVFNVFQCKFCFSTQLSSQLLRSNENLNYPINFKKISIPPPKN